MEIIVINDGSRDRTSDIARALPVTLIEHEITRGYGASLKEGLLRAKGDLILISDADGTYPLHDIPRLAAEATSFDMVVGARTGEIVRIPFLRRTGKWIITQIAQYLSRQTIPDLNSGFRIFRRDIALRFVPIYPDGFSFTTRSSIRNLPSGLKRRSTRYPSPTGCHEPSMAMEAPQPSTGRIESSPRSCGTITYPAFRLSLSRYSCNPAPLMSGFSLSRRFTASP